MTTNQAASAHWRTPTVIVKGVEGAFCFALELIFAPVVLTLLVNKCVCRCFQLQRSHSSLKMDASPVTFQYS